MTDSISFDRAASFYDSTRELPEEVLTRGIPAILEVAGPRAFILDAGTGTGRISMPMLRLGANLVGCDISPKMMALLREKYSAARLARADVSQLPFPSGQFDAVTTCHVMHLVGPWREALREYRRVLRPGGVYINARYEGVGNKSEAERIHEQWEKWVGSHGSSARRPGAEGHEELLRELAEMHARVERVEAVRYVRSYSANEVMERIENRIDSSTWGIPEALFASSIKELREWATQEFEDLDKPLEVASAFILDVAHF